MTFTICGAITKKTVRKFTKFLDTTVKGNHIAVVICSQGGDAYCARAIAGMIKDAQNHGRQVDTAGYGDVHSAAALIFAAGQHRLLSKYATVMMHQASGSVEGSTQDVVDCGLQMEAEERQWCQALEDFTGTSVDEWLKIQEEGDKYLTPDECLKLNLATELV